MKIILFALMLFHTATYAGPAVIWKSPYAKVLTKGISLGGSDTSTTCVTALAGSIRYNAGTFEGCNGSSWASLGGSSGTTYSANQYGVALSSATNATLTILAPDSTTTKYLKSGGASANPSWSAVDISTASVTGVLSAANGGASEPYQITNCSIGVTVGSSAVTFTLLDGAGAALSSTSPCIISFRNATAATGTYTQVTTTAAVTVVGANADSLGCPTAAAQCIISVYAINNAGTVVLGALVGGDLDEGSVQTSVALTGGADIASSTLWSTAAQSTKAVRLLSRVTITPASAFAWTNAVTEISPFPFVKRPWYINASISGAIVDLGVTAVASYTAMFNGSLTMTPVTGSAPVGVTCSSTNAATAPSTGATTCAAGTEGLGGSFNIPAPGVYEACMSFVDDAAIDSGEMVATAFEIIETPTNAQTISLEGGERIHNLILYTIATGTFSQDIGTRLCGIFDWTGKAAGTAVALRLMYEQDIVGTPNNSRLMCDSAATVGQRSCSFTVKRL